MIHSLSPRPAKSRCLGSLSRLPGSFNILNWLLLLAVPEAAPSAIRAPTADLAWPFHGHAIEFAEKMVGTTTWEAIVRQTTWVSSLAFAAAIAMGCWSASAAEVDVSAPRSARHADIADNPYCKEVWRCGRAGCNWRRVCVAPCPDGVSCHPLYGAYGPYGGIAYWGAYTDAGWGYR
jgi:hypothetical protein